ncbi:RNA-binding protein [Dehalococcoidia bacterium]|nr:RNA-binding protein [Dehalococcoidia bacterium]
MEFADEAAATKAIEKFDGHELQRRRIRVSQAEKPQSRSHSFTDAGPFRTNQGGHRDPNQRVAGATFAPGSAGSEKKQMP